MQIATLFAFIVYFGAMLGVGVYFFTKNKNMEDYFLGGRQLNSWVTALSAQASDMSGWLLMGLPAAAYFAGLSAGWIALGLAIGTYLNWRFVAEPLRKFTAVSGDSITIPQYLQNRFLSQSKAIRSICALMIAGFFLVYTAAAFSAGAKLFQKVFGLNYVVALTIGAVLIISYTFLGGFLAVCWTDFVQGILMLCAIVAIPIAVLWVSPDLTVATLFQPEMLIPAGAEGNAPISVISNLAWALGYFGMPHILVRFMAIESHQKIKKSRRIAMVWVCLSLTAALLIGILGYHYLTGLGITYPNAGAAETIFMDLVIKLTPPLIAGVLLSAILAAIMSTADSQLLVTASAVSNDFYKATLRPNASEKETLWVSRIAVLSIALLAYLMAFNPNSTVMGLVSYAWAGFGAAFGPVILLSLCWKRMTTKGALAGMLTGGVMVFVWESVRFAGETLGGRTGLYSMIPGVILATLAILLVSRLDREPSQAVYDLFHKAKQSETSLP